MISAVVLTHDEGEKIAMCISTLLWCDEIIIVDDFSNDKTTKILNNLKFPNIKIYSRHLDGDYASQRNFAQRKATGEWVLFVDADEIVSEELQHEILQATRNGTHSAYLLKRQDQFWGKKLSYGETGNIKLLRLAKKNAGVWVGKVHEEWKVTGKLTTLDNPLIHTPHPTIQDFISSVNNYTSIRSKELFDSGKRFSSFETLFFPIVKFIQNYFLRLGFLDGLVGLIYAYMMSIHSLLVRIKLYDLSQTF